MNPPKRLTDPTFVYVPANETCIAKTFARVRQEIADARREQQRRAFNVKLIKTERKA